MKLFHKIRNLIYLKTELFTLKDEYKTSENPVTKDIRQRELELFGEEKINQQRLYEKWVVKDTWRLLSEALPLLSGFDPDNTHLHNNSEIYKNKLNEHWSHAKQCVEQGLLPVINRDNKAEDWQVHPIDVYRWARISRIGVPETLASLMEFIFKTVKKTVIYNNSHNEEDKFRNSDGEYVLGMALAILASTPERCRNEQGRIAADKIVEIINEKGEFWLGDHSLRISSDGMRDLINEWLKTVP